MQTKSHLSSLPGAAKYQIVECRTADTKFIIRYSKFWCLKEHLKCKFGMKLTLSHTGFNQDPLGVRKPQNPRL